GPRVPVQRFAVETRDQNLVIGVDGTLYVSIWGDDHPVAAIAPASGARRWSFVPTTSGPPIVPPYFPTIAAGPEGNLYVAYQQGAFYALDGDGSVRWQFTTGKSGTTGDLSRFTSPLIDAGGRVYVGESSQVYAFESDGHPAWRFDTRSIYAAIPAGIAADGTVYVKDEYGPL